MPDFFPEINCAASYPPQKSGGARENKAQRAKNQPLQEPDRRLCQAQRHAADSERIAAPADRLSEKEIEAQHAAAGRERREKGEQRAQHQDGGVENKNLAARRAHEQAVHARRIVQRAEEHAHDNRQQEAPHLFSERGVHLRHRNRRESIPPLWRPWV